MRRMGETPIKFLQAANGKVAFIDLEASGLGSTSWPVEVGWAFETGEPVSMLIKPDETWSDQSWDDEAERLHRLSRGELERDGVAPREACSRMNRALADAVVHSDAPDWDGFWLFRLFSAARARQEFKLHDYSRLVRPLAGARAQALLAEASRIAPRQHRVAPDIRHLQTFYRLASQSAAAD